MSVSFNGVSSNLEIASNILPALPVSMFCWFKPSNVTQTSAILSGGGTANELSILQVATAQRAQTRSPAASSANASVSSITSGIWQPTMAVFASATSRTIRLRTLTPVTNTMSIDAIASTLARFRVGMRGYENTLYFLGDIAEIALWSTALTQTDYDALAAGALPETIQPAYLIDSWSLLTDAETQTGTKGTVLTGVNTAQGGSHPITRDAPSSDVDVTLTGQSYTITQGAASVIGDTYSTLTGKSYSHSQGTLLVAVSNDPSYQVGANGALTLYTQPLSAVRNGKLYAGMVSTASGPGICVTQTDLATRAVTQFVLNATFKNNNHDPASIGFTLDGRVICFYSAHNDTKLRYRISTNPEDISAFGSELFLTIPTETAYNHQHYLSTPGRHYVHYRQALKDTMARSSADLATWDTARSWVNSGTQRPYTLSVSNGIDRIDLFFSTGHPNDTGVISSLYHAYIKIDAAGTEVFYKSDGTVIGAGPATPTNATLVYDGSVYEAWNTDIKIGVDGHPRVIFTKYVNINTDHRHMFVRFDGTNWLTPVQITTAGGYLFSATGWSDGQAIFDARNLDVVYATVSVTGKKVLKEFVTEDNGLTWAYTRDMHSGHLHDAYTPSSPKDHDGRSAVVFGYGTQVNFDNITYSEVRATAASWATAADVAVTLSGQSAPCVQGSVSVYVGNNIMLTLSGQNYTHTQGTTVASVGNNITVGLSGQAYALTQGLVGKSATVGLYGQYKVFTQGAPMAGVGGYYTITLAGQGYLHAQGAMSISVVPASSGEVTLSQESISAIADEIMVRLLAATIPVNIKKVNDLSLKGAGTRHSPWNPA